MDYALGCAGVLGEFNQQPTGTFVLESGEQQLVVCLRGEVPEPRTLSFLGPSQKKEVHVPLVSLFDTGTTIKRQPRLQCAKETCLQVQ